jgi:hypothetical protein
MVLGRVERFGSRARVAGSYHEDVGYGSAVSAALERLSVTLRRTRRRTPAASATRTKRPRRQPCWTREDVSARAPRKDAESREERRRPASVRHSPAAPRRCSAARVAAQRRAMQQHTCCSAAGRGCPAHLPPGPGPSGRAAAAAAAAAAAGLPGPAAVESSSADAGPATATAAATTAATTAALLTTADAAGGRATRCGADATAARGVVLPGHRAAASGHSAKSRTRARCVPTPNYSKPCAGHRVIHSAASHRSGRKGCARGPARVGARTDALRQPCAGCSRSARRPHRISCPSATSATAAAPTGASASAACGAATGVRFQRALFPCCSATLQQSASPGGNNGGGPTSFATPACRRRGCRHARSV